MQCEKRDDGKGEFYVAVIARKGRATADVLAEVLPECFAKLPWPKSMRWPQTSSMPAGTGPAGGNAPMRWVRPLHSILCTLDGEIVPFHFAGIGSSNRTRGHRFLSEGPITARRFDDYVRNLRDAHVILDAEERKAIIFENVKQSAFIHGLELIPDEGLLEEVAGLAEWPVVLTGEIDPQFMDVPPEILQTAMRVHQKYFALRDPKTGQMANRFAFVANMVAQDGGKEIVRGNERVLRARLSDAKFFWDQDRKVPLADRVNALGGIVFHAKLGTQLERVERIEALAGEIAEKTGAGLAEGERNEFVAKVKRAARLCKADLTTGVVGEFPELQGVMGRYYALNDGEDPEVADAIRDHYKPLGPSDAVPIAPVSIAVALADKLDQLVGFFAIDEKPTGSSDPYALRRAALGSIRILVENGVRLRLSDICIPLFAFHNAVREPGASFPSGAAAFLQALFKDMRRHRADLSNSVLEDDYAGARDAFRELLAFLADRLKVALREKGTRHDLIDAVFSLGNEDDLVRLVARVEALQDFLKTDDGANLLVAYRRAANILKAEEKKDKAVYDGEPDPDAFVLPEEKALFVELATASELIKAEVERERFGEAMGVMARLRKHVDAFFDKVTVNDKDAKLRKNRLLLLSRLRTALHQVADFSKIEG